MPVSVRRRRNYANRARHRSAEPARAVGSTVAPHCPAAESIRHSSIRPEFSRISRYAPVLGSAEIAECRRIAIGEAGDWHAAGLALPAILVATSDAVRIPGLGIDNDFRKTIASAGWADESEMADRRMPHWIAV